MRFFVIGMYGELSRHASSAPVLGGRTRIRKLSFVCIEHTRAIARDRISTLGPIPFWFFHFRIYHFPIPTFFRMLLLETFLSFRHYKPHLHSFFNILLYFRPHSLSL